MLRPQPRPSWMHLLCWCHLCHLLTKWSQRLKQPINNQSFLIMALSSVVSFNARCVVLEWVFVNKTKDDHVHMMMINFNWVSCPSKVRCWCDRETNWQAPDTDSQVAVGSPAGTKQINQPTKQTTAINNPSDNLAVWKSKKRLGWDSAVKLTVRDDLLGKTSYKRKCFLSGIAQITSLYLLLGQLVPLFRAARTTFCMFNRRHRNNCECCPVSQLIVS